MSSAKYILSGAAVMAGFIGAQAALDLSSSSNIALYWGQNSYNQASGDLEQHNLAYYCENSDVDVLQLAFVTVINGPGGAPEINFANIGDNCTTFDGTSLLNCPQVGADIKTCQDAGKTILLSIGGATYSEGGFSSKNAATAGAQLIWETFGPDSNISALRPFGDAVVDGFDFDFEATVSNMATFGNELRSLMDADTSKKYYLTAAPQCVYPDAADNQMLDDAVKFDAIWVQFYNNYCGVNNYVSGPTTQNNYNFETWDSWAKNTSANPDVKVFVGVPGNTGAAGTGYLSATALKPVLEYSATFSSFGGVMIWDASQAYANNGFISGVASDLGSSSNGPISRIMRRLVDHPYW
ncbi:class III chitinase, putative [Talaromyces stipitatus ATCC 10500]|uniref:chitinase n=1 Tax=Talaromyces stipitatus (strain ATCC 10500 / CBS 375.48 / QM 6759 / NRRL 1006) TaxID=441959 RepID=B8MDJ9_TALSN|nr:class III chitinase, putative [Talaromyces stipitatus ATCC 10500]EED17962.1 class III chitinase, putative [Talaromyces stipitatus ATCC 10500]